MEDSVSFQIDHDKLDAGMYRVREDKFGNVTFDLRFKKPHAEDVLTPPVLHSIEHMLATALRSSGVHQKVVYVGPMGCRTGFYLILYEYTLIDAMLLVLSALRKAVRMTGVPHTERKECGYYTEHDYEGAVREMKAYLALLEREYLKLDGDA